MEREAETVVVLRTSISLTLDLEMQEMEGMLLLAVPLEDRDVVPETTEVLLIPVRLFYVINGMSAID